MAVLFQYAQTATQITFPINADFGGVAHVSSINVENNTAATLTLQARSGRNLRIIGPYRPRSYTLNDEDGFIISSDGTALATADYLNIEASGGGGAQISPFS